MVNRVVCFIEMEADVFQHSLRIGTEYWVLATVDQVVVDVFLIGNGKITSEHQVLGRPVRLAHEGVTIRR